MMRAVFTWKIASALVLLMASSSLSVAADYEKPFSFFKKYLMMKRAVVTIVKLPKRYKKGFVIRPKRS